MLTVNCQSSIKITEEKVFYFDPLKVNEMYDADYIFITHTHWDHFSKEDIVKIKKEDTKIIGPKDIKEEAITLGFLEKNMYMIEPYQELSFESVKIKTVPAYNKEKPFHPKENNWVGYVITINNTIYYITGDTDALKENESIDCDVLFVPIGGTYTMNKKEAAEFTNKLNPKTVIPIHYGLVVGTKEDINWFKLNVNNQIKVKELIVL